MKHRTILLLALALLSASCAEQPVVKKTVSPPPTPVATIGENGLDGDEEQAILGYHNQARASVSVKPLVWSKKLALQAASWSAKLATQNCAMQRSKNPSYGENIFIGAASQSHGAVVEAAKAWESQKINYPAGKALNKASRSQAGEYTQMVWRNTTEIGCAKSVCANEWVVVCHYSPAGNHLKQKPY
jgi:pathogenesis-related protein 1